MTSQSLVRLFVGFAIVLSLVCEGIIARYRLHDAHGPVIVSVWSQGKLVARAVTDDENAKPPEIEAALEAPGVFRVNEVVTGTSPILTTTELAFAVSLVAARDGVKITYKGQSTYVTPDELLSQRGYDVGAEADVLGGLQLGADVPLILALASDRLHTPVRELKDHATFERIRVVRRVPGVVPLPRIDAAMLNRPLVEHALMDAARYLARGVNSDGKFRYMVDAATNKTLSGYDWPRHSGATYFLAQAATLSHDPQIVGAALRAGSMLRDRQTVHCGEFDCIGSDDIVDLGSAALAVVAYAQIAKDIDPSYKAQVERITPFLRRMQREDGEFMHQYDRTKKTPIDIQFPYYSGEATLALARAYGVTKDPKDLEAAKKGLARIVGGSWSFFGDRYYFGEEHWTCQAMDDLWDAAPDPKALDFCMRWQDYMRAMQLRQGETPHDGDGAYMFDPVLTPRLTPVASRCEAGVASLDAARKSHLYSEEEMGAVDGQLRRALALILRQQFAPGPTHLFADPEAVRGAIPGSEVDWQIRIDYAQHAGSAMVRWLEVVAPR